MATTVEKIQDSTNQYIGDTTTNSVSANDRLRAITEAVRQMYNDFEFDFSNRTLTLDYYDTINYYEISTDAPDFTVPAELRRSKEDNTEAFTRNSGRTLAVEIAQGRSDIIDFAIETKNFKQYLVINHTSKYGSIPIHNCDSLTANGTWTADVTTSDAENLTIDTVEKKVGTASLNFDLDVSQSANNRVTIAVTDMAEVDLEAHEDLSAIIAWVYIPDVTYTSSVTLYWGTSSTVYWSAAATTDAFGADFADGWNRILVEWSDATETGSPDASEIDYFRVDINYTASQGDDTDYRVDDIISVRPEEMQLIYQSNYVGVDDSGDYLTEFTSTNDIPLYSGVYDYFDVYVSHKSAAILFRQMGQNLEANDQETLSEKELNKLKNKFPSTALKPSKSFKVKGLRW